MHGRGVDDDAAGAASPGELDHLGGHGQVALPPPTNRRADGVGAVVGAGRGFDGLALDDSVQSPGGFERRFGCVEHDGSEVEEHGLQHVADGVHGDRALTHGEPQRVDAVLDVADHVVGGDVDVRVGEPRADVPAVQLAGGGGATGERRLAGQSGVGEVVRQCRCAQRGDADAVEGLVSEQAPDVGVRRVVRKLLRLAQDGGGGLLPVRDADLDVLGEQNRHDAGIGDHRAKCMNARSGAATWCDQTDGLPPRCRSRCAS
jgi:hypothetical protein